MDKQHWVECIDCGNVYSPAPKSSAWWQAVQNAKEGRNTYVGAKECGCSQVKPVRQPDAPYRVFGYDMLCEDFDIPFERFTDAVATFRRLNSGPDVVFIKGVSDAVNDHVHYHSR